MVVGDATLARWPATAERLRTAVAGGRGRRGVRTARRALPLLDGRAESPPESVLRLLVHEAGLPRPVPQLVVTGPDGRAVARVDLGWPDQRVAVEYDGRHHMEAGQWQRDLRRRERLEELGWRVVVVTREDLAHDPLGTAARVRRALTR
ncbi:DUF559 domain-containing protein [Aquipuribacter sp. SD81]|uniref:DUF559 domain-containing protein n=1 Tax=Aquipuribacter sp. SD81 TaxID=3127703 RepID=UPI003019E407